MHPQALIKISEHLKKGSIHNWICIQNAEFIIKKTEFTTSKTTLMTLIS